MLPSTMGKKVNQGFVFIPFARLVQMIQYKAELAGIRLQVVKEEYTSKCSFLDGESVGSHDQYMGCRVHRGLFKTAKGYLVNADVNGAYNILKKAVPNAFVADGIEALGLVPQSIRI